MKSMDLANKAEGEELQNPVTSIPRSMILAVIINGMLAFGWIIALLFSIGDVSRPRVSYRVPYHRNLLPSHWLDHCCDCNDVCYHNS